MNAFREIGAQVLAQLGFATNLFQVRLRSEIDPILAGQKLLRDDDCVYAIPEFAHQLGKRSARTSKDSATGAQWQWEKLQCPAVWKSGTRGRGVRIAVIDQGFDLDDRELAPAVTYTGYFRERRNSRADFYSDPRMLPCDDHGTYCASLAIGRENSARKVIGAAPESGFIPIVIYDQGIASLDTLARAIAFAADPSLEDRSADRASGADIVSCSLEPSVLSRPDVEDAVRFATTKGRSGRGCVVFYAVANTPTSIASDPIASIPEVIKVGRSTIDDRSYECAYGPELDFLAPGAYVVASLGSGPLERVNGTSFATPIAAGVAALTLSKTPALNWRETRERLRATCDKIGNLVYDSHGHNARYGYGRLNAYRACLGLRN